MPCPYEGAVKSTRAAKPDPRCKFRCTESARLTPWQAGAQPFDPAPRDLRMNRAVARFTSSAPPEYWSPRQYFAWADTACRPTNSTVRADEAAERAERAFIPCHAGCRARVLRLVCLCGGGCNCRGW